MLQQTQSPTTESQTQSTKVELQTQSTETQTEISTVMQTEAQTPSTFFEAITEFELEYTYSPQKYRK